MHYVFLTVFYCSVFFDPMPSHLNSFLPLKMQRLVSHLLGFLRSGLSLATVQPRLLFPQLWQWSGGPSHLNGDE